MYYHEADFLVDTLQSNDIMVTETSRVRYKDANDEEVIDLIIIGKKININKNL